MVVNIQVRPFQEADAGAVRALFIKVNELLAPKDLADAFKSYVKTALKEEVSRIAAYYAERQGAFWVATANENLVGMFGLEPSSLEGAMELRRMYVDPDARRQGIARTMLLFAEDECRRRKIKQLDLSTSELQGAALSLYRNNGYELVREETATVASNKTLGGGISRYHFTKRL